MNTRPNAKVKVDHTVHVAGNNDGIKQTEKDFRTGKLGKYFVQNKNGGGIELAEDNRSYKRGSILKKVIIKDKKEFTAPETAIDCNNHDMKWLKFN